MSNIPFQPFADTNGEQKQYSSQSSFAADPITKRQ